MDSISKNEAKDDEQRNLHKPHDSTALAEKPTPDPNQKDRKSIEPPQTNPTAHVSVTAKVDQSTVKKAWIRAMKAEQLVILLRKLVNLKVGTEETEKHFEALTSFWDCFRWTLRNELLYKMCFQTLTLTLI